MNLLVHFQKCLPRSRTKSSPNITSRTKSSHYRIQVPSQTEILPIKISYQSTCFQECQRFFIFQIIFISYGLVCQFLQKDTDVQHIKKQFSRYEGIIKKLETEKKNLEEKLRMNQVQKEMFYDESEVIQNSQQSEIAKLKMMLNFREQVAVTTNIRKCFYTNYHYFIRNRLINDWCRKTTKKRLKIREMKF